MRVLLDTTFARRAPHSGTAVYVERLAGALRELGGVELLEVSNRRRRRPGGGGLASARNALADQWWTEIELPRLARAAAADVIHHPLPARAYGCRTPQVITVHDLAFERLPERFDPLFGRYARFAHRAAARGAGAVVCVSHCTANDVRTCWGVAAERLVIAPHGPGQALPPMPRTRPSHFLYVGDEEPRKNLPTLIEAYRRYRESAAHPLELVLAGSAAAPPRAAGVRSEAGPDAARLARLYAGAAALVHPALHEGFGMTPLEAMRLGTPVIAAAAPGITEVCGDAARYVDPRDVAGLVAALTELAGSAPLRGELADRGLRRVARYSWAASARKHLDAYSLAGSR